MTIERAKIFVKRCDEVGIWNLHPDFVQMSEKERFELALKIPEKALKPEIRNFLNMSEFKFKLTKPIIKSQIKKHIKPFI